MNTTTKFIVGLLVVAAAFLLLRHGKEIWGGSLKSRMNIDLSM